MDFIIIVCLTDDCPGMVVWVVDDEKEWEIFCPRCGQDYGLKMPG